MNTIQIPDKFAPFLEPHRYKTAYGGRGGGKSWTIARLLVHIAARQREFIVCGREFQNSIEDSVYRLLEKTIKADGLPDFVFTKTSIENTRTGSEFVFKGLSKLDGVSIKSLEGANKLWIEEGQNISHATLDNVIPTIREAGSEIWCSFNPTVEDAPVWQRLVLAPPPDSVVVRINWNDNPWFPAVLEQERLHMLKVDPVKYKHIWEGVPLTYAEGAIFREEMAAMQDSGRIGRVPHDPTKPVYAVFDLGHAAGGKGDPHAVIFAQPGQGAAINIIDYWEGNNMPLPGVVTDVLLAKPYRYAKVILPHDGRITNSHTGKTDAQIIEGFDLKVELLERTTDLDKDMNNIRVVIPYMVVDEGNCKGFIAAMKNHRREKDEKTGLWRFKHDWTSHGVSAARYLSVYHQMNGGLSPVTVSQISRRSSPW